MDPLTLAMLLGGGASIISNISSGRKEDEYQKKMMAEQVQANRKSAIERALGAKSLGVLNPIKPPDLSMERTLGAIGQIGGMAAGGMAGARKTAASPQQDVSMDDPNEAIRRRMQNSFNPYGGEMYG